MGVGGVAVSHRSRAQRVIGAVTRAQPHEGPVREGGLTVGGCSPREAEQAAAVDGMETPRPFRSDRLTVLGSYRVVNSSFVSPSTVLTARVSPTGLIALTTAPKSNCQACSIPPSARNTVMPVEPRASESIPMCSKQIVLAPQTVIAVGTCSRFSGVHVPISARSSSMSYAVSVYPSLSGSLPLPESTGDATKTIPSWMLTRLLNVSSSGTSATTLSFTPNRIHETKSCYSTLFPQ